MLFCLALSPALGEMRKQLDLALEAEPPAILCLNPVSQLVISRLAKRDGLENAIKQLIKLSSRKSLQLLSALDHDKVITARINFDMRARKILRVAIRRQRMIPHRSNQSRQSCYLCFNLCKGLHCRSQQTRPKALTQSAAAPG
jgi:hypothetical protein